MLKSIVFRSIGWLLGGAGPHGAAFLIALMLHMGEDPEKCLGRLEPFQSRPISLPVYFTDY